MTGTPDRAAETAKPDGEPAMPDWMRQQAARRDEADLEFTDLGRRDDPVAIRARIALIRAHLAAAAHAERNHAPPAYADQDSKVLDEHQADDRSGVDGRGWSR